MTLGDKIRERREYLNLSREELAVQAQVSYSVVVRTELGRSPRWENVVSMAKVLGFDLGDFATLASLARAS